MKVIAIDPSIRALGMAVIVPEGEREMLAPAWGVRLVDVQAADADRFSDLLAGTAVGVTTLKSKKGSTLLAIDSQAIRVIDVIKEVQPDAVAFELPALAANANGHHALAGVLYSIASETAALGFKVCGAPPASIKKFMTGRGNASKFDMVATTRKTFPGFRGDDNAADALSLSLFTLAAFSGMDLNGAKGFKKSWNGN